MKMQVWKVYISEGAMDAIHGGSHAIYEGFIPDLKLTVNQMTSFVNGNNSRYKERSEKEQMVSNPQPELMYEIELSRTQIEDAKILASEDNPEDRMRRIIATTLIKHNLDASAYNEG